MSRLVALLPELTLLLVAAAVFAAATGGARRFERARAAARWGAALFVLAAALALFANDEFLWATYRVDAFSQLVKLALAVGLLLTVLIARDGEGQRTDVRGELFFFLVCSTGGLVAMASSVEAVALYLALEIASFSLFVLVPMREGFAAGREAALKFLIVGLAASTLTLFGLSILVGLSGTTSLAELATALPGLARHPAALFGLALFLSGFLFKLAVFPFHFWAPDAYQGAANGVAAFLATASKVGALAVLVRLVTLAEGGGTTLVSALVLAAAISMTLGNLVAIVQRDLKRLLAYSAVAQAGYIVVGLVAFTPAGTAAALYYGLLYLLMNAAAFLVVARVASDGSNPLVEDLAGLYRREPLLAATLLVALFALAGLPPTAGFAGKWFLFSAAVAEGWWLLVLLAAVNSTVSVYYYLLVVKAAYLLPGDGMPPVRLSSGDRVLCYGLSGLLIALGVLPTPLYRLAEHAVTMLP